MASLIDTNILTAFLTNKEPYAKRIKKLFAEAPSTLVITDMAIAELVWILESYYKLQKTKIVELVDALLNLETSIANVQINRITLDYFKKYKVDYIDAYHAAYAQIYNLDGIYSLDKDFDKIAEIKRKIP